MEIAKRVHFYATPDDQAVIADIKEIKPHWSTSLIIREGLLHLCALLEQQQARDKEVRIRNIER